MIKQAIAKVVERQDLSEGEMIEVMNQIMGGEATPAQIGAFITALRMKGETVAEITGAARVMRERATPIRVGGVVDIDREEIIVDRETIIDTCGTGGSGTKTFNVSTTVALAVAACGGKVAKHGNRSISSTCGSADVLEKLGVNLDVTPEQVARCIDEIGVGFLFAPALNNPEFLDAASDGFLQATIARGRGRTPMRPFGESSGGIAALSESQISDIVSHIRNWDEAGR